MPSMERLGAPVAVLGLQALLLGDVVSHRPKELLDFSRPIIVAEWVVVVSAVFAYLCTVTAEPGFLRPPGELKPVRPPAPLAALGWPAAAVLWFISFAQGIRGDSTTAISPQKVKGAREMVPIGRTACTLDFGPGGDNRDEGSDPGEETIDPADLECGGTLVVPSPTHELQSMANGHDDLSGSQHASSSGRSLGAIPGSPRPGAKRGSKAASGGGGSWHRRVDIDRATSRGARDEQKRAVLQSGHRLRFCKVCALHQPLRTKHCRDCGRCVRTHDHHCPWVGTCVGEGNRLYFYWFLVAQFLELLIYFIEGVRTLLQDGWKVPLWIVHYPGLLLGLFGIGLFLVMVTCLLCFHSYLAMVNLTTWESLSWHHISYLRSLHPEEGSPFSSSLRANLAAYCCPPWCPPAAITSSSGSGARSYVKRTEDGWAIWDLGEPTQPLDMDCEACGCGKFNLCPCFDESDSN